MLGHLRSRGDLDVRRVALWGDSFSPPNPKGRNLAVPLGVDEFPDLAEPLGGLLALFGGLFEDGVRAVSVRGGLTGYHSLLQSPFCYVPHDALVPGALTAGDLCDVAAVLAPRPLRLEGLVDGLNREVPADVLAQTQGPVLAAYRALGAEPRLQLGGVEFTNETRDRSATLRFPCFCVPSLDEICRALRPFRSDASERAGLSLSALPCRVKRQVSEWPWDSLLCRESRGSPGVLGEDETTGTWYPTNRCVRMFWSESGGRRAYRRGWTPTFGISSKGKDWFDACREPRGIPYVSGDDRCSRDQDPGRPAEADGGDPAGSDLVPARARYRDGKGRARG